MAVKSRNDIRELIKCEELVKRAQDSVLGDNPKGLSTGDVGVIKLLLNKVLPDIKAIEHTGSVDGNVTKTHRVLFK